MAALLSEARHRQGLGVGDREHMVTYALAVRATAGRIGV